MKTGRFFAFFLLLCAGFCSTGADLTDRIPASADLVIGADLHSILQNPLFQDKQQDLTEALVKAGVPEKYAKKPASCFGNALLCVGLRQKEVFALAEMPHITLENAASFAEEQNGPSKIGTSGQFRYIVLQPGDADPVLAVELQKGLFLLTAKSKLGKYTGKYPGNAELKALYGSTNRKAVLRGAMIAKALPHPKNPEQAAEIPKPDAATLSLQLTGEKGTHVILDSRAIAANGQDAARIQLGIQQMLLMISIVMGDDPDLAQEVIQSVRISRKDATVFCRADLPSPLTERLAAYAEKKAGETQPRKQLQQPLPFETNPGGSR